MILGEKHGTSYLPCTKQELSSIVILQVAFFMYGCNITERSVNIGTENIRRNICGKKTKTQNGASIL